MIFDTKINTSGFDAGVSTLKSKGQSAVSSIGSALGGMASAAAKAATVGYIAAATATTTAGVVAVKTGISFEESMSKVAATSGASGEALERLSAKAREMGATTEWSASDAAEAMNYMAMAGWKTEDMIGGIDGIMNLASASGENLATTSDIVTDALTAFGKSADDAGTLADIMAAASSNANTNVAMMGETFKYVAPVAGTLGYTMEDTALAIGLMANSGIKSGQAGTSLRAVLTRLVKPTDDVEAGLEALGMSADISGKSMRELFTDMRKGWGNLSETERAKVAAMIAGQEGLSGLAGILNASESDWNKLAKAIDESAGSAKEMAEVRMDNLAGDMKIIKSQAEEISLQLYDKLGPGLRDMAQSVSGVLQVYIDTGSVDAALDRAKTLVPDLLDALGGGLSTFNSGLANFITSGIEGLAEAPNLKDNVSKALGSVLDGAIEILDVGNANFEKIADGIFGGLKETVTPERVSGLVSGLFSGASGLLDSVAKHGPDIVSSLLQGLKNAVENGSVEEFSDALFEIINTAIEFAADNIDDVMRILGKSFGQILRSFFEASPEMLGNLTLFIANLTRGIIEGTAIALNEASGGELGKAAENLQEHYQQVFKEGFTSENKITLSELIAGWFSDESGGGEANSGVGAGRFSERGKSDGKAAAGAYQEGYMSGVQELFDDEEEYNAAMRAMGYTEFPPFDEKQRQQAQEGGRKYGNELGRAYLEGIDMGIEEAMIAQQMAAGNGVINYSLPEVQTSLAGEDGGTSGESSDTKTDAKEASAQLVAEMQSELESALSKLKDAGGLTNVGTMMLEAIVAGMQDAGNLEALSEAVTGIKTAIVGDEESSIAKEFEDAGRDMGSSLSAGVAAGISEGSEGIKSALSDAVSAAIAEARAQVNAFAQDPFGGTRPNLTGSTTTNNTTNNTSFTFNSPKALNYREMREEVLRYDQYQQAMTP